MLGIEYIRDIWEWISNILFSSDEPLYLCFVLLTRYSTGEIRFGNSVCEKDDSELYDFKDCSGVSFEFELLRYLILETYPDYYTKYTREEQDRILNFISSHPEIDDEGEP